MGSTFGLMYGAGDNDHPNGVRLHVQGSTDGHLLEVAAYDSDFDSEVSFFLNGAAYGGIPYGSDQGWTSLYQLYLPPTDLMPGDNSLEIVPFKSTYTWGVRIGAIYNGSADLGYFGTASSTQYGAAYLIPVFGLPKTIDFTFYDIGSNEVQIFENGSPLAYVPNTGVGAWGVPSQFPYSVDQMVDLTFDNPGGGTWGARITNWQ